MRGEKGGYFDTSGNKSERFLVKNCNARRLRALQFLETNNFKFK